MRKENKRNIFSKKLNAGSVSQRLIFTVKYYDHMAASLITIYTTNTLHHFIRNINKYI